MINKERLVQTFISLAKIYGPSKKEELIRAEVFARLKSLGYLPQIDEAGNLFLHIDGVGEPFLLDAHFDTVEPCENIQPIIEGDVIKSNGHTILGGDDRAGIAIILEILQALKEDKITTRPLDVLIAVEEEIGGGGLEKFDFSKLSAKTGLCLDSSEANIVTVASPFITTLDISIQGKLAHAGVCPEKGINAIKLASDAISKIFWGRLDDETTCNVGLIFGGTARNAVPDLAFIKAEARSHEKEKMEKVIMEIKEKFSQVVLAGGGKIDFQESLALFGYTYTDQEPIIQDYFSAAQKLNLPPVRKEKSGGGTDVNHLLTKEIRAAVIGVGYYNEHTKEEYVKISEMYSVAQTVWQMII